MVQVRGIEDRLFPRIVDSYSSPEFQSLTPEERSDVRHLYTLDRIFEIPYAQWTLREGPSITQTMDSDSNSTTKMYLIHNKYNGSPSIRLEVLVQQKGILRNSSTC